MNFRIYISYVQVYILRDDCIICYMRARVSVRRVNETTYIRRKPLRTTTKDTARACTYIICIYIRFTEDVGVVHKSRCPENRVRLENHTYHITFVLAAYDSRISLLFARVRRSRFYCESPRAGQRFNNICDIVLSDTNNKYNYYRQRCAIAL